MKEKEKIDKVYCKNCKWNSYLQCMFINPKKTCNSFTGNCGKYGYGWKADRNANGRCKDYRPKWWRKLFKLS